MLVSFQLKSLYLGSILLGHGMRMALDIPGYSLPVYCFSKQHHPKKRLDAGDNLTLSRFAMSPRTTAK
jgi:hypothetical protein